MNKKIGLSISGGLRCIYGERRSLEILKEVGADAADFELSAYGDKTYDFRESTSVYSQGDDAVFEHFSKIKRYADSLGIIINQTHGRGDGFINKKEADDALVENSRLDLLASAALGAKACVIHNVTTINMGPDASPELMRRLSLEQYTRILPYAAKYKVKLATETFGDAVKYDCVDFFGNINEFTATYDEIKNASEYRDWLTVCVDTGHSNKAFRFGNPSPADVIRTLGKNVTLLHLNDNDKMFDQHKPPLTGTIDWHDVLAALDEIGYDGVYNMELGLLSFGKDAMIDAARFSVSVMRGLLNNK